MPDAAPTQDWVGKPCPKCSYVRPAGAPSPDWQCPGCHIAYEKFVPGRAATRRRWVSYEPELALPVLGDRSLYVLIAANVAVLALSYAFHASLRELVLAYWIQNVVIGWMHVFRILNVERFAPKEGDSEPIAGSPDFNQGIAWIFGVMYVLLHLAYLLTLFEKFGKPSASLLVYALYALVFLGTHGQALGRDLENDRRRLPSAEGLMFLPYVRVIPMHLVVFGSLAFAGQGTPRQLLLFGAIKTAVDAFTHILVPRLMVMPGSPSRR